MNRGSRGFIAATIALGAGAVALAAFYEKSERPGAVALLAAAAAITELLEVRADENTLDGDGSHSFSFSSGIHLAAVMIVGPWQAALVAATGVLLADFFRGAERTRLAFNASVFALAALAAGLVYQAVGASPGDLQLPRDFAAIGAMALVYLVVNRTLVATVVSLTSSLDLRQVLREAMRAELSSAAAEVSLGVTLGFFVLSDPWKVIVLGPLVLAMYQALVRLAALNRETTNALETFANVVDERDPYTFRHSERVADLVGELAEALGLPAGEIARLRWAGKLHDLGKIAVDSDVLRKPGRLDNREWEMIQRHPRLSARLLLRFRFASAAARAVEYHHERYAGDGYYGIGTEQIPLAAHFLIVADSYDAMVTNRPYRSALTHDQALAEIEAGSGTQFHPAVARAFIALKRGENPVEALSPPELVELRGLTLRRRPTTLWIDGVFRERPEALALGGIMAALAGFATWNVYVIAAAAAVTALGIVRVRRREIRRRMLARSLTRALAEHQAPAARFRSLVDRLAQASPLTWAGLLRWDDQRLHATLELDIESHGAAAPSETALSSWLIRDADARGGLLVVDGRQLGRAGAYAAAPVREDGRVVGYAVLGFAGALSRHVELAVRDVAPQLGNVLPRPNVVRKLAAVGSAR